MAILAYLSLKKAEAESLDIFIHSIIPNFMLSSAEHELFFITSGQELRQILFFRVISGGKIDLTAEFHEFDLNIGEVAGSGVHSRDRKNCFISKYM